MCVISGRRLHSTMPLNAVPQFAPCTSCNVQHNLRAKTSMETPHLVLALCTSTSTTESSLSRRMHLCTLLRSEKTPSVSRRNGRLKRKPRKRFIESRKKERSKPKLRAMVKTQICRMKMMIVTKRRSLQCTHRRSIRTCSRAMLKSNTMKKMNMTRRTKKKVRMKMIFIKRMSSISRMHSECRCLVWRNQLNHSEETSSGNSSNSKTDSCSIVEVWPVDLRQLLQHLAQQVVL